jgi:hypothetical protein
MYFRAPLCIDKYSMHGKIFVYTHLTWRFSSDKGLECYQDNS